MVPDTFFIFLPVLFSHDRLYGEAGRDILIGFEGGDVLEGGENQFGRNGAAQLVLTQPVTWQYCPLLFANTDAEILPFLART
jgi:hypothetical protein